MLEEINKCPFCGEYILSDIIKCPYCDEFLKKGFSEEEYQISLELRKFNWGAFLFNFIWGLGNKTYIAILILPLFLIKPLYAYFAVWLGIKGNRFAWEKCKWKNFEHFKNVQRKWALWGVIFVISLLIIYLTFWFIGFYSSITASVNDTMRGY